MDDNLLCFDYIACYITDFGSSFNMDSYTISVDMCKTYIECGMWYDGEYHKISYFTTKNFHILCSYFRVFLTPISIDVTDTL